MAEERKTTQQSNFDDADIQRIIKGLNRFYQEVSITRVIENCPYGHREGETFRITDINHDGLCGALFQSIHSPITSLHYGGSVPWETKGSFLHARCPEDGRVQVEIKRIEKEESERMHTLRTRAALRDMTGKGFPCIDNYRVFVEIIGIANKCGWGNAVGNRIEVDPFNAGGNCGSLYWKAYPHILLLFTDSNYPWEADANVIHGVCPDTFNQVSYRLVREKR